MRYFTPPHQSWVCLVKLLMNYCLVFKVLFSNFDRRYLPAYPQISALYRNYFVLERFLNTEILGQSLNRRNKTENYVFYYIELWCLFPTKTSPVFKDFFSISDQGYALWLLQILASYLKYFVLHRLLNTEMSDQIGENTGNYRVLLHWTATQISDEKVRHFQRFFQKVWPRVWAITSPNFSITV